MKSLKRLGAVGAGVTVCLTLSAAPAFAGPARASHALRSGEASREIYTSPYFGGYETVPDEGVTSASTIFRVPMVTCFVRSPSDGLVLGDWIDETASDLYPDSASSSSTSDSDAVAGASIGCTDGQGSGVSEPVYTIFAETYSGGQETVSASAGNRIQVRVEETSSGQAVSTVNNLTTGATVSSTGASNGNSGAVFEGGVPQTLQLPGFTKVSLTNSEINGLELSQFDPFVTYLDQNGPVQLVPSAVPSKKVTGDFTISETGTN